MSGHAMAAQEHVHGGGREACPHTMADEGVRHAVVVVIDVDVVVEGDRALLPLGVHVRTRGQGAHGGTIERLEDTAPRSAAKAVVLRSAQ